jgi:hypothetical protein
MDFFTVEAVTLAGLVRYHVLFVIDLASRRVELAGIVRQPHEAWMLQVARNLTDAVDGFLVGKRYLIMDRDPLFTHAFPYDACSHQRQECAVAGTQPELERLCGALCALGSRRMSFKGDSVGRAASA